MDVISLNVGTTREVDNNGQPVRTGIFKIPVSGRLALKRHNFDGDQQADLSVHGGSYKAVYAYPFEHYSFWEEELGKEMPSGSFGENLTTAGLLEADVSIGDRFRIGSAELQVTQPRLPCYKLALRFGDPEMVRRFLHSGRCGFYLAVITEGEVGTGDKIALLHRAPDSITISDLFGAYTDKRPDPAVIRRASQLVDLPQDWRTHFGERL